MIQRALFLFFTLAAVAANAQAYTPPDSILFKPTADSSAKETDQCMGHKLFAEFTVDTLGNKTEVRVFTVSGTDCSHYLKHIAKLISQMKLEPCVNSDKQKIACKYKIPVRVCY